MSSTIINYKMQVKDAFSRHVDSYDSHADLQVHAANLTAEMLRLLQTKTALPDGDVLEIGCGTGFLTRHLLDIFPERRLLSTDISEEMLSACRIRAGTSRKDLEFMALDAETFEAQQNYAVIASSFAFQWFYNPLAGITRLLNFLKPGGVLIFSVPGHESCPNWRESTEKLSVPFTRNPMPSFAELQALALESGLGFRLQTSFFQQSYPDALTMLQTLKELGAGTQRNQVQLSFRQLRQILRLLDQDKPVKDEFQIINAYFRRPHTNGV